MLSENVSVENAGESHSEDSEKDVSLLSKNVGELQPENSKVDIHLVLKDDELQLEDPKTDVHLLSADDFAVGDDQGSGDEIDALVMAEALVPKEDTLGDKKFACSIRCS